MKKVNIVRSNIEFNNVINAGIRHKTRLFYIYINDSKYNHNRYGIAISKKIGNAVVRNKFKRQIRDIIDDINIVNIKKDIVVIAKMNIKDFSYNEIKNDFIEFFNGIGEKNEEKKN